MLVVIVGSGRDRPAHRLGARLPALAGLPGRRLRSRRRATTSYIEFSNRIVAARRRSSPRSPPSSPLCAAAALRAGCAGSPGCAFVGTLAPGAARGDHRPLQAEPLARGVALPALDRRARARRARRARGLGHPRRAGLRRGSAQLALRRRRRLRALLVVSGMLATAAGPHSGSETCRGVWQFQLGGLAPRPRDRRLRRRVPRADRVAQRACAAATSGPRSSCSGCSSSR